MQNLQCYAPLTVASCAVCLLATCACAKIGTPEPFPRSAPMRTSRDIAVGLPPVESTPLVYPVTARVNVAEAYGGIKVEDPYRWLENLDAPATRQWVEAQNRLAQPQLEAIAHRAWVKQRLTQLWNYERFEVPVKEGGRYFFLHNDGKQNQSVLFASDTVDSPGRVLFDPNTVRQDATVPLSDFTPSPQGDVVAYALSDGGTDWQVWGI